MEQGLSDPLKNSLGVQQVIRGIEQSQDLPSSTHLPITDGIIRVIDSPQTWPAWIIACFGQLALLATLALASFG